MDLLVRVVCAGVLVVVWVVVVIFVVAVWVVVLVVVYVVVVAPFVLEPGLVCWLAVVLGLVECSWQQD